MSKELQFPLGGGRYDIPSMMLLIGHENEFHEEANESHDRESHSWLRSRFLRTLSDQALCIALVVSVLSLANCFTGVRAMFAASILVANFQLSDGHRTMHETPLNK
eukprot:EC123817.1.p1 GENE.EC123817.1~~EC123817.1.p1  ORF type:complete len:106 (-),score=0.27 EC123817.1:99-416(-)